MAAKKLGGQRDWLGGRWWAMALGLGEGTTTQMWSPAAPCGNLPVFNVGERTAGGQVLPNGNRALLPPVKKFSN